MSKKQKAFSKIYLLPLGIALIVAVLLVTLFYKFNDFAFKFYKY